MEIQGKSQSADLEAQRVEKGAKGAWVNAFGDPLSEKERGVLEWGYPPK